MGAIYEVGVITTSPVAGAPYATIHAGNARIRIKELHLVQTLAQATQVGLARASNTPVASASAAGQPRDGGDAASLALIDTAWTTAPTLGATPFLRRATLGATVGSGAIWSFPEPLIVPVNAWLVLWNFAASSGGALNLNVIYDE